jgi:hypothetical protein
MTFLTCLVFVDCVRGAVLPPDPADPTTWGNREVPLEVIEAPATASAQIAARARARKRERAEAQAVSTQGMSRAKGRMLAAVETDKNSGKKVAKYVLSDGTVEKVELKVLHTARVKEKQKARPLDAGHGVAVAVGAALGAAGLAVGKKLKG